MPGRGQSGKIRNVQSESVLLKSERESKSEEFILIGELSVLEGLAQHLGVQQLCCEWHVNQTVLIPGCSATCKYLLFHPPVLNCKPLGFAYTVLQGIIYANSSDLSASSPTHPKGENSGDTKILLEG